MFTIAVLPHSPGVVYQRSEFPGLPPSLFEKETGIFMCIGDRNPIHPQPFGVVDHSRRKMHETCLIIIHDPGMRPGPESNWGPLD